MAKAKGDASGVWYRGADESFQGGLSAPVRRRLGRGSRCRVPADRSMVARTDRIPRCLGPPAPTGRGSVCGQNRRAQLARRADEAAAGQRSPTIVRACYATPNPSPGR